MRNISDVHIRVISRLNTTQQVLLYQQETDTNTKIFLTAAWEHPQVTPKPSFDVVLPFGAQESMSGPGLASSSETYSIEDSSCLDICGGQEQAPLLSSSPVTVELASGETFQVECAGQEFLTITLKENPDGSICAETDFSEFDPA